MGRRDKLVKVKLSAGKRMLKNMLIKSGLLKAELSEQELRDVLDAGTQSGALDKAEHELIKSILEFSDITVKEIMVPRPDIIAVDIAMPTEMLMRKVIDEGYSRIPVYRGTIDNVVGVIYTKDLLSLLEHRDLIILQDIIRPVYVVPESKKISQLLKELQLRKVHLAIVVDEYGGTEGLITMEDIIEEIVGEILDEYDEVARVSEKALDGSTAVDAAMGIDEFNKQFNSSIPEASDYGTIAGFLQKLSGKLPEVNEEIKFGDFQFTILSKSARRIRQVKITPFGKEHGGDVRT